MDSSNSTTSYHFSSRLGTLTRDRFEAALDRLNLGRFVSARPVLGGNFGQVLFLTSTEGEWVFRGNPLRFGQFAEERYFSERLHQETSAPAAWPYLVDPSEELFGWPYVIMPRMPGFDLEDEERAGRVGDADRREIADRMGVLLAETQRVTNPWCAAFDPDSGDIAQHAGSYVDRAIAEVIDLLGKIDAAAKPRLTAADRIWAKAVIDAGRIALERRFIPRLTIPDFKDQNMTFRRSASGWKITGLFDLMGTSFSNGEAALARQLSKDIQGDGRSAETYVRAYARNIPPREGFPERLAFYVLAERLGIWEWAWRTDVVWWDRSLTLLQWAEPFVIRACEIGNAVERQAISRP